MSNLGINARPDSRNIRLRLIICIIVITITPMTIIGMISYFYSRSIIIKKISQYSIAILTQTAANIQLKLAEFESHSVKLFINKEFDRLLEDHIKENIDNSPSKKEIEAYFNEYLIDNQNISAFMFICDTNQKRSIIVAQDDNHGIAADLTNSFTTQSAYRNIVKAGGGIVWSSPITINRSHFVILGRYIKVISSGEPLGVLAIVIDEDQIDRLANMTIYNRLYTSPDEIENYSIIINDNGEIVSTPFKEDIGKNIATIMRDVRPLEALFTPVSSHDYDSGLTQGGFITAVNQKQTLVTYTAIGSKIGVDGKSGWHLLNLAPTSHLYAEIRSVGLIALLLGLVFGLLSVLIAFYSASFFRQS